MSTASSDRNSTNHLSLSPMLVPESIISPIASILSLTW